MITSGEERLLSLYYGSDEEKKSAARARLEKGEPIAYILGETVFYNETYTVGPDVLIPRPDTERVVDHALRFLPRGGRLLDLCTGSGCIAVSCLCHSKDTGALLVDISAPALEIAKINARRNGVYDRCSFLQADILTCEAPGKDFDVIVSNPPYVDSDVVPTLERECLCEPRIAFDGGRDGMDFYRALLRICPPMLKKGGRMVFEIGYDQKEKILALCARAGLECAVYKDYGKNDRVAVISLPADQKTT